MRRRRRRSCVSVPPPVSRRSCCRNETAASTPFRAHAHTHTDTGHWTAWQMPTEAVVPGNATIAITSHPFPQEKKKLPAPLHEPTAGMPPASAPAPCSPGQNLARRPHPPSSASLSPFQSAAGMPPSPSSLLCFASLPPFLFGPVDLKPLLVGVALGTTIAARSLLQSKCCGPLVSELSASGRPLVTLPISTT